MTAEGFFDRTLALTGGDALNRLRDSRVLIVGLGGVGGYAAEMLARIGVGYLRVVDADAVAPSNLNRQIIALHSTVGLPKADLIHSRIADINPEAEVDSRNEFVTPENAGDYLDGIDLVIDAIDTVAPKVALIAECMRRRQPILSAMGAGGRMDPSKVIYCDLWETRDDGLARAVRQRLKKLGLRRPLRCVASTELPAKGALIEEEGLRNKRTSPGSSPFVPPVFGIFLAAKATEILTSMNKNATTQEHI